MRNLITGLDIGSSAVRVVVTEARAEGAPVVLAMVKRPARGLRRGYIINLEEAVESVAETLREAEKSANTKIRRVVLGVSGISLESKVAEGSTAVARGDLEVGDIDINRALDNAATTIHDAANQTVIHRFPLSFKLDGKKVFGRPEGMKGSKLETRGLFISYSTQHLKDLVQAVEAAGVEVADDDVVASPLAGGLVILGKVQKTAGVALITIGSQTTSVAVFEEGLPLSMQVFPVGSTDITNDIALGLKIPLDEAERVKRRELDPPAPRKKLDEIIDARLSDIFECVEGHLKKLGRSGLLPAGVILSGGGANIDGIEDLARDYLHLPAKTANSQLVSNPKGQLKDPVWAVAYGLTLFGESEEPIAQSGKKLAGSIFRYLKEFLP
jgi:cell division protein FtsA